MNGEMEIIQTIKSTEMSPTMLSHHKILGPSSVIEYTQNWCPDIGSGLSILSTENAYQPKQTDRKFKRLLSSQHL